MPFYQLSRIQEFDPDKKTVIKVVSGLVAVTVSVKLVSCLVKKYKRDKIIAKKKKDVMIKKESLLQKLYSMKTPMDNLETVAKLSVPELREKIDKGGLEIIDILETFQAKALAVDSQTNCVSECIYDADVRALHLQSSLKTATKGPLFGIPVTIKDMLRIKGYDATYGLASRIHQPANWNCAVVNALLKQGAIPYMLTNMAQLGFSVDSSNPIFGETVNPHNHKRTAGGSSGGEGAIVGGGGSPLGFGTDLGGSVRIPSAFNGICGLRPTAGRLSWKGIDYPASNAPGNVKWTVGPMGWNVDTLVMAMRALLTDDMFSEDATVPPLPFNEEIFDSKRKLKIGYYYTLKGDTIESVSSVRRGVEIAKQKLEAMGHELVPFEVPNHVEAFWELALATCFDDGGKNMLETLENEYTDPTLSINFSMLSFPRAIKTLASILARPILGGACSAWVKSTKGNCSTAETWKHIRSQERYVMEYLNKWSDQELDALICPVTPFPAPPVGLTKYLFSYVAYTMVFNLVNCPAGVVPVTKVTTEDVKNTLNNKDYPRDFVHNISRKMQEGSEGMPICVQCVTAPWQEELCLRLMRDLEAALKE